MENFQLVAYHDIIATVDGIKKKFAEMGVDKYPQAVYEFIFDYCLETQTQVVDTLAWSYELTHITSDDEHFASIVKNETIVYLDANGAWYI